MFNFKHLFNSFLCHKDTSSTISNHYLSRKVCTNYFSQLLFLLMLLVIVLLVHNRYQSFFDLRSLLILLVCHAECQHSSTKSEQFMLVFSGLLDDSLAVLRIHTYPTMDRTFIMDSSPVNTVVI